jgi:hypothetical protein
MNGLFDKYTVINNVTNEVIKERTFTLVPSRDPAAVAALRTYAQYANKVLANDLNQWLDDIEKGD